jgi:hypothetical protein
MECRKKMDIKYKKVILTIRVLICWLYFYSSGAFSDPVWEIIDESQDEEFLNSIDMPLGLLITNHFPRWCSNRLNDMETEMFSIPAPIKSRQSNNYWVNFF